MPPRHLLLGLGIFAVGVATGYLFNGSAASPPTPADTSLETDQPAPQGVLATHTETATATAATEVDPEPPVSPTAEATSAPAALPNGSRCIGSDAELSKQLSLFAERLEAEKIPYNNREPEKLSDCSGIFHRTARFVGGMCGQYAYPTPQTARDSRSLARWYYEHGNLAIVHDIMKQRDLIRPGAVLFFGGTGKRFNNPTPEEVTAPYPSGIIEHIGVVTEVKKDDAGHVNGYVMFHGRRPGVHAQRSHYHKLEPPRAGFPPLGNWNQQLVAIAYIMTPEDGSSAN